MPIFEPPVVAAVLAHMNGDHTDDNVQIVRAFGAPDAESATMIGLDDVGGTWQYRTGGTVNALTVAWSRPITERAEIRREVVALYDTACERLGLPPRGH